MRFPYVSPSQLKQSEIYRTKQQATDFIRQRGTEKQPGAPRDIIVQASSRSVLISWSLPAGDSSDISGWRVYSPDESTLAPGGSIQDRGVRQYTLNSSAGLAVNAFISSVNSLGVESTKVQATGTATTEAGAPSVASPPPGYSSTGGSDTTGSIGTRTVGNHGFPQS